MGNERAAAYVVTQEPPGTLRIIIPTPWRSGRIAAFGLLALLFGGAFVGVCVLAVALVLDTRQDDPGAFIMPASYFPTTVLPGLVFSILCLWHVAGREVVTVDDRTLTTRKEVLGVGTTKQFDLYQVGYLLVSMDRRGGIYFEHDRGIHRFGRNLNLKDGHAVVATINRHLGRAAPDEAVGQEWLDREDEDRLRRG